MNEEIKHIQPNRLFPVGLRLSVGAAAIDKARAGYDSLKRASVPGLDSRITCLESELLSIKKTAVSRYD